MERGLDVDDFAPRLSLFFNAHNDFFEELAKYRAARRICVFFFNDTATTEIYTLSYTLSLHDALPDSPPMPPGPAHISPPRISPPPMPVPRVTRDRKSTRLNSSHIQKSRMPSSA